MYQETLQFYHLWRLAVQERDEAREHLKQSLTELSQLQELFNTILLSEEQKIPLYYPQTSEETTDQFSGESPSRFSSATPMYFVSNLSVDSSPAICDSDSYSFQSKKMGPGVENMRDFETVALEMIGGVLPENGKFLQAVSEAGSLVESLFITGPVPKWRNPPVQLSSQRPVLLNNITGKWIYGGLEFGPGILNRSFPGKMSHLGLIS